MKTCTCATTELHLQSSHSATGMSTTISANRLSYAFDFMGPSMIIDTACSSSLVAAHLACRSLQTGEAEIAIAGGLRQSPAVAGNDHGAVQRLDAGAGRALQEL